MLFARLRAAGTNVRAPSRERVAGVIAKAVLFLFLPALV